MIERMLEPEFWAKWFTIAMFVFLVFVCFGSAFDRTQDISQIGRVVLAIMGAVSIGIATAFYRMDV